MMKYPHTGGLIAISALLAACNHTAAPPVIPPPGPAPASSSEGYATAASNWAIAGPTYTYDAKIVTLGSLSTSTETITMTWTTFPTDMEITYKGETIALDNGGGSISTPYAGTSSNFPNGISLTFKNSRSGPVVVMMELEGAGASGFPVPPNAGDTGFVMFGANTSPAEVAGIPALIGSGSATYLGPTHGEMRVIHDEGGGSHGFATASNGSVSVTADFTAGTIAGTISSFTGMTESSAAYAISSGAVVTLSGGTISFNEFDGTFTISGADVGMNGTPTGTFDGMFYAEDGTQIAGTFDAMGTTLGTGNTAYIYGAFLGER